VLFLNIADFFYLCFQSLKLNSNYSNKVNNKTTMNQSTLLNLNSKTKQKKISLVIRIQFKNQLNLELQIATTVSNLCFC
jgi:hypothetical protein